MSVIPVIIPISILVLCIVAFIALRRTFDGYFAKLEDRTSLLQRVLYLVMTKDIVSFFASPEANRIVDILFDEGQKGREDIEDKLLESVQSAGPEIEKLYSSLKRAYSPSAFIYKARSVSFLLRLNILFYGVAVSVSELVELFFLYIKDDYTVTFMNGIVFGGTLIFAVALATMAIYIFHESRKIDKHMERLSDPSLVDTTFQSQS
ncbi:hypothetical protein IX51_10270 [uncultured archaeon]|nr:hypothetical protein IX51_10270 [uncultured archaeon]